MDGMRNDRRGPEESPRSDALELKCCEMWPQESLDIGAAPTLTQITSLGSRPKDSSARMDFPMMILQSSSTTPQTPNSLTKENTIPPSDVGPFGF